MQASHTIEAQTCSDTFRSAWCRLHLTFLAAALASGCGPEVFTGDPADAVFDSEVGYNRCSSWGLPTPQEWGLFVLFVGYDGDGPTMEHLRWIHEVGGLVVHEYAVPIVQAVVRPRDLGYLRRTGAYEAHGVMVPNQYRVRLDVWIAAPEGVFEPDDEDRQRDLLESLGGEEIRLLRYHESGNTWEVTLPDESIPDLRERDDVVKFGLPGGACLAANVIGGGSASAK